MKVVLHLHDTWHRGRLGGGQGGLGGSLQLLSTDINSGLETQLTNMSDGMAMCLREPFIKA